MKENNPNNIQEVTASAARQDMHEQMKNAQVEIVKAAQQSENKPK